MSKKKYTARERHALVQVYLARLFRLKAPMTVLQPLSDWCDELEEQLPQPGASGWEQNVGLSDGVGASLIDVGGKSDA